MYVLIFCVYTFFLFHFGSIWCIRKIIFSFFLLVWAKQNYLWRHDNFIIFDLYNLWFPPEILTTIMRGIYCWISYLVGNKNFYVFKIIMKSRKRCKIKMAQFTALKITFILILFFCWNLLYKPVIFTEFILTFTRLSLD